MEFAKVFKDNTFFGYEISPTAVDAAKSLVTESGLDKSVTILQQDIENTLPVSDGYFRISIAKYILPFIEDKISFLAEMKRISSHGVIIATPVVDDLGDVNLSKHGRSISMQRDTFHNIMKYVFGNTFAIRETLKDNRENLIEIEVVTAKTGTQ